MERAGKTFGWPRRYGLRGLAIFATLTCVSVLLYGQAPKDKSGVKPNVISLPSGAGSIEGLGESFEPQMNTGGSDYGISIAVPPGRVGLVPSVRVGYNSYSGNGLSGLGWTLDFPSIKRQTDKGFPEYNSTDTFIYGGEELVPLNNPGKDWRCENEREFRRLRQVDSNDDGLIDSWEVTERNGTRRTFGRFRGQNNRWSVIENSSSAAGILIKRTVGFWTAPPICTATESSTNTIMEMGSSTRGAFPTMSWEQL